MSGVLTKIMPSRAQAQDTQVVADLDDLIARPVGFRFRGRVYQLAPVSTRKFMEMANLLGEIQTMIKSQSEGAGITENEIYQAYHRYISVLCHQFTTEMLKSMTLPQVHALLNLVIKQVTGQPMNLDTDEKKKMTVA